MTNNDSDFYALELDKDVREDKEEATDNSGRALRHKDMSIDDVIAVLKLFIVQTALEKDAPPEALAVLPKVAEIVISYGR